MRNLFPYFTISFFLLPRFKSNRLNCIDEINMSADGLKQITLDELNIGQLQNLKQSLDNVMIDF